MRLASTITDMGFGFNNDFLINISVINSTVIMNIITYQYQRDIDRKRKVKFYKYFIQYQYKSLICVEMLGSKEQCNISKKLKGMGRNPMC